MKTAIMQPYLFPYIGYFQLMQVADIFVVYDDVNYINRGWINRNRLLGNGQDSPFCLPLQGASQNRLISEIELQDFDKYRVKFLKTIEINYRKAPFFSAIFEKLQTHFTSNNNQLNSLILNQLEWIIGYLALDIQLIKTSSVFNNSHLKAQNRILDICQQTNTTQYINAIGGQELYQKSAFEEQLIQLSFLKTSPINYPQFKHKFVPYLSILDVLMFNTVAEIQVFLKNYELI